MTHAVDADPQDLGAASSELGPPIEGAALAHALADVPNDPASPKLVPPAPPPPRPLPELPEGVKLALLRDASGVERAELEIEHPELGALRVELRLEGEAVDVRVLVPGLVEAIRVSKSETKLREMLEARGARLGALTVREKNEPVRSAGDRERPRRKPRGRLMMTEA
ncbi:MAG: flagellar hook-length control protein FliK [Sandaracinaceae bacterium]